VRLVSSNEAFLNAVAQGEDWFGRGDDLMLMDASTLDAEGPAA
jgi:hypothetical protein